MSTFAQGFGPFSVALIYYYYSVAFDLFFWVMERLDTILFFLLMTMAFSASGTGPMALGGILCFGPEKAGISGCEAAGYIEWIWTSENGGEGRNRMFC